MTQYYLLAILLPCRALFKACFVILSFVCNSYWFLSRVVSPSFAKSQVTRVACRFHHHELIVEWCSIKIFVRGRNIGFVTGRCDCLPSSDFCSEILCSRVRKTGPTGRIFSFGPLEEGQEMRPNPGRGHRCRGGFTCWLSSSSECAGAGA